MAAVDIEKLSEAELIDLNHRIVARLRLLRELAAHASMLNFHIGERVTFQPEGRARVTAVITRYNKKTVSLLTENGQRWNVAPQLLQRVAKSEAPISDTTNVIALLRRPDPPKQ
jgi:hypothetical protein